MRSSLRMFLNFKPTLIPPGDEIAQIIADEALGYVLVVEKEVSSYVMLPGMVAFYFAAGRLPNALHVWFCG
jgi:hypothetical protein